MTWQEYIALFSAPIGIAVTAIVAIYTIRRIARESRISNIHSELVSCLVDTVYLIEQVLSLLDDIANHRIYRAIPEEEITETAFDRYWRKIGELSDRFREIQSKQRLILPRKLYEKVQEIVLKINEARKLARNAKPNENYLYPNTSELKTVVDIAISSYRELLHESRKYFGTDKLKPISLKSELPIKAKEDEEQVSNSK